MKTYNLQKIKQRKGVIHKMNQKTRHVGEDALKSAQQKGITLIALVITIIVLLILAGVTISMVLGDEGIIAQAQKAEKTHAEKTIEERAQLAYQDYMIAAMTGEKTNIKEDAIEGGRITGDPNYGWSVIGKHEFMLNTKGEIEEKTADQDYLERYLLGENKQGINPFTTIDPETNTPIINQNYQCSNTNVQFLNMMPSEYYSDHLEYIVFGYLRYNDKAYRVEMEVNMTEMSYLTKSVILVYIPSGEEGNTVEYSYDGTEENKKEWTILYDNGDNVEILSPDLTESISLGGGDIEAKGETNLEKAIYSYNNAIKRLNDYATSKITNENKISVRSVGSNPNSPNNDNSKMYSSDTIEEWNADYNGVGKKGDIRAEQDVVRMSYHNGVIAIGTEYWLASRRVDEYSRFIYFNVRYVNTSGMTISGDDLWFMNDRGEPHNYDDLSRAVRPVVKIES